MALVDLLRPLWSHQACPLLSESRFLLRAGTTATDCPSARTPCSAPCPIHLDWTLALTPGRRGSLRSGGRLTRPIQSISAAKPPAGRFHFYAPHRTRQRGGRQRKNGYPLEQPPSLPLVGALVRAPSVKRRTICAGVDRNTPGPRKRGRPLQITREAATGSSASRMAAL